MISWRPACAAALATVVAALAPAAALAQDPGTAPPALPAGVIAPNVTIAGVPVGGLDQAAARQAVLTTHVAPRRAPVVATFRGHNLRIDAVKVGYVANVDYAIQVALLYGRSKPVPPEGVTVPLKETVNRTRLTAALTSRAAKFDLPARDASVHLKGVKPVAVKARIGQVMNVPAAVKSVEHAILFRDVPTVALATTRVIPAVRSAGPIVIIDKARFRLTWWKAGRTITFPVAVGMPGHDTPVGNFRIIQKQTNPTWFPPSSPWAAGLGPIPPGVNNPLGTRWMGTSAPGIGMHGTPISSSIGTRASHGCIRMYIHDAERLYNIVSIGTPVYIR